MLALNQNVKLGLQNIRSGSPPHNNWWSLGQPSLAEQCSEETFHAPKQQGTVLSFLIQNEY